MKKKQQSSNLRWEGCVKKLKWFCCFVLILFCALPGQGMAQEKVRRITLDLQQVNLDDFVRQVKQQTGHTFFYPDKLAADIAPVTIRVENATLEEVLQKVFGAKGYDFVIEDKTVIIRKKAEPLRQQKLEGVIVDERGATMPGVTIRVKGTTLGTSSDVNGRFALSLPQQLDLHLVFSFVGMVTSEIAYTGQQTLRVVMSAARVEMEEVVVTGYQTISKERATGAYSIVNAQALEQKPTANLASALNGLVPGLTVQSSPVEGTPRFVIRGKGTLQDDQADSDPLIVVDGFPISGYGDGSDPFETINPNDVESVTVLKDAAATSIYGARAANGVIVITTKKGKAGNKLDISADAYWSVSSRVDLDYLFNMASAENQIRYIELDHKYSPIMISDDPYQNASYHKSNLFRSEPYMLLFERDIKGNITDAEYQAAKQRLIELGKRGAWKDDLNDYVFRHALRSQYNVALRGTTERMNYAFSASYDDEKGYLKGNDKQRVMLNMAANAKLTKNLTFDVALSSSFAGQQTEGSRVFSDLQPYVSPWTRLVEGNGEYTHIPTNNTVYEPIYQSVYEGHLPVGWHYNPIEDRQYIDDGNKTMNYRVQGGFAYKTTWGLNLSAKGQYEWRRYTTHLAYEPESFYVRDLYNTYSTLNSSTGLFATYFPTGGIFRDGGNVYEGYNLRGQADYNHTFDKHAVSVLVGTEVLSATTETTPSITRYGYNKYTNSVLTQPDYNLDVVTIFNRENGTKTKMPYTALGTLSSYEDRFFSVYANASYTLDDRYSLTGSFRTDASNFQSQKQRDKFSPFWSVGAGWLISREHFMKEVSSVDQLKLRASFGIAGVAAGKSRTSSVTTLATLPGDNRFTGESYNSITQRGNKTLTWEKSRTLNIGADVALWGYKLSGSIEYYNKFSYDVLSNATVPVISQGQPNATFNNAEVVNRGMELSLSSNLRVAGDLKWQGTLNYAYNRNEVKKFYLNTPIMPSNPGFIEGYPMDMQIVVKPVGYTPEGYIILQGKDGGQRAIVDKETALYGETIARQDGENLENHNWYYYLGTTTPKSNLSFTNRFTWKGVTLSFMITGRFGYYTYRGDYYQAKSTSAASFSKQLDKAFEIAEAGYDKQSGYSVYPLYNDENYQTYKNVLGNEAAMLMAYMSSASYIKGDHIRLNEIYLGYDLPERWMARQGIFQRVNIYAQASNLGLIWSKNKEMDPDYGIGSIKPMPIFTFGLKVNFKNW